MGAGPIGLFVIQCLKLAGVTPLILTEPVAARAELGRRLGADLVLDPTKEDVEGHCSKLTREMGPEMVFECVGIPQTVLDSVSLVRKKGKVMWVGFCPDEVTFTPALWFFKKISIQTSFGVDSRDEVHHCMKLIQDKKVAVEELVSEIISIDEVPRAFERLLKPNTEVKILVGF
jgi:threonine dehydrogenase-like Zn-dependent dehydrogenase